MNIVDFGLRLLIALLLGALVGIERQWRQKRAGLRTNTLVSTGAAAFTLISFALTGTDDGIYRGDTTRIIGQIVTGIGFLGAGVIMRDGLHVQGLNTAATIWCSAAVGCLAGVGLILEAFIVTVAVLLTHLVFRPFGLVINKLNTKISETAERIYTLRLRCRESVENHLRVLILKQIKKDPHFQLRSLRSSDEENPSYPSIEAEIYAVGNHDTEMENLASLLTLEYGVVEVSWKTTDKNEE